eukprot:Protomagalhaensia_sp_Gyna_25__665@NODE_130_length_5012_cov_64_347879_g102_i0_p3_GENE_NODE_130_length_5012_cov_64_347879_g102_i0NODE_130_length_5012_cov_64_347879_g102_i0_p3_ORF_typecomplete_len209_score36_34_NODE_130_length_5012_cov_64_347879_g102_i022502876
MATKRRIQFCDAVAPEKGEPRPPFLKGGGVSVSVTTCDAFTDDLLSEESDEIESEFESDGDLRCRPPPPPPPSLPSWDCNMGGDEDSQALLLETYILNLIKKSTSLSFSSLIGLRHDLELLGLADLLALLRALFALTETLQCESLTQLFAFHHSNHVIEAAGTVPTTEPARQVLLSLIGQISTSTSFPKRNRPDSTTTGSNSCSDFRH